MEKGEWGKSDYKFKIREYKNKIQKEEIAIQKWKIEKDEIALKIANLDLNIDMAMKRQEELQKNVDWLETKLEEKNG